MKHIKDLLNINKTRAFPPPTNSKLITDNTAIRRSSVFLVSEAKVQPQSGMRVILRRKQKYILEKENLLKLNIIQYLMFKTDKKTLEGLSFSFDERDVANLRAILEHLRSNSLLTISQKEVQNALQGLDAIGKLKLDGKIYAFHVDDSYADFQFGNGEGVELYLRQGDTLREFYVPESRDYVYSEDSTIRILKEKKIPTVYTGEISHNSEFLGLPYECDEEDPVRRMVLRDYEIEAFESENIRVVRLDHLI